MTMFYHANQLERIVPAMGDEARHKQCEIHVHDEQGHKVAVFHDTQTQNLAWGAFVETCAKLGHKVFLSTADGRGQYIAGTLDDILGGAA